jgi:hypothetical protein
MARKARWKARVLTRKIKAGLNARLSRLDPEKLKRVLVACGIAASTALVIIALSKLTPLLILLLAILGLGVVLELAARLRFGRIQY